MTLSLFLVIIGFGGIVIPVILLWLSEEIGFDWYSKFFEKKEELAKENRVENKKKRKSSKRQDS